MNALGAASRKVSTPPDLAEAMVRALGDVKGATWLEPGHGKGAFVEALARFGVTKDKLMAIDIDSRSVAADRLATTMRGVDFLQWAKETNCRFDRIVGNPPFISISQLPRGLQETAASVLDLKGREIGRGANLWYAFVLACLPLLREGGCLAFVLPSAAEFANYCAGIGQGVAQAFGRLDLFRCGKPLFDEVQEGTLVAVARDYGRGPGLVSRRFFESRAALTQGLLSAGRVSGHRCPSGKTPHNGTPVTLGSVADISLGGVTGDACFFLMNDKKRSQLRLPTRACIRVVSKARHLRSATLTGNCWENLRVSGERIWLLNPSATMAKHPQVKVYLTLDPSKGGCNRKAYKVSIRDPWYRTPMPSSPDAFLSGMSQRGPWLCINQARNVSATNTLYVVRFLTRNKGDWYRWALALLTTGARRQLRRIGRRYPDGLVKYEPGPLGKIALPKLKTGADHRGLYIKAVTALLANNSRLAREIADSALL